MFRSEGFYFVRIIYIFFSNTHYVNYNVKSFLLSLYPIFNLYSFYS